MDEPLDEKALAMRDPLTLADCPIGLFAKDGELCLKTEYGNNEGRIDAYIVSSGEFFWGGTNKPKDQRNVMVNPVVIETTQAGEIEAVAFVGRAGAYGIPQAVHLTDGWKEEDIGKNLYYAVPSFDSIKSENDKLREYYEAQEEMRRIGMMNASTELYGRVDKARDALAGQEKQA